MADNSPGTLWFASPTVNEGLSYLRSRSRVLWCLVLSAIVIASPVFLAISGIRRFGSKKNAGVRRHRDGEAANQEDLYSLW